MGGIIKSPILIVGSKNTPANTTADTAPEAPRLLHIIAPPKNAGSLSEAALKKAEAAIIISALDAQDYLVLLDERGKQVNSPGLAQFIQQRANESTRKIVFLIGGAFGVDETITQRADFCWSLSPLVFPHMLVRLILAEQVYRACTILRNEKYHHN